MSEDCITNARFMEHEDVEWELTKSYFVQTCILSNRSIPCRSPAYCGKYWCVCEDRYLAKWVLPEEFTFYKLRKTEEA